MARLIRKTAKTLAESGFSEFEAISWFGLLAECRRRERQTTAFRAGLSRAQTAPRRFSLAPRC
jgi:hypothetical protein